VVRTPLRPLTFFQSALLISYHVIGMVVYPIFYAISFFIPALRRQVRQRGISDDDLIKLSTARKARHKCAVFFCSSAGEYEQALPLIRRYEKTGNVFCVIFFNSVSGFEYANVRSETTSFFLGPIDFFWRWQRIFKALQPDMAVIIRYELWPSFLANAHQHCKLILVNASVNKKGFWSRFILKSSLLRFFDEIFVVGDEDRVFFSSASKLSSIAATGDTKYDRVIERAREQDARASEIAKTFLNNFRDKKFFIVGSGWQPDISASLKAYVQLPAAIKEHWTLVIAPHDISSGMMEWIRLSCRNAGLSSEYLSRLELEQSDIKKSQYIDVILVDSMGKLAEIYGVGQLCLVGGGFDRKIHNVLEPAARGLVIAVGPKYVTQKEAVILKEAGLATVVQNASELATWWQRYANVDPNHRQAVQKKVGDLCGAATRIFKSLEKDI
jgi:3-deoxy-D-manno-octulosonic-acid transferase